MTDVSGLGPFAAASRSGSVRPPSASAPARRNVRRETGPGQRLVVIMVEFGLRRGVLVGLGKSTAPPQRGKPHPRSASYPGLAAQVNSRRSIDCPTRGVQQAPNYTKA